APSNQIVDSGLPPASFARSRRILEESISHPNAALASVLAMITFAYSIAVGGRSWYFTSFRSRARARVLLLATGPVPLVARRSSWGAKIPVRGDAPRPMLPLAASAHWSSARRVSVSDRADSSVRRVCLVMIDLHPSAVKPQTGRAP